MPEIDYFQKIDRLIGAGLVIKVKIINSAEIPFEAFTEENRFPLVKEN